MHPSIYDSLSHDAVTVAESLSAMMQKEQTTYTSCDYLHPARGSIITESDRMQLVDWCYSVVDKCAFDRELVATTMEMVDRFLSTPNPAAREALHDRCQFQLVAIASLYIAIKVNEQFVFGSESFAALSQGVYSVEDIEGMELSILEGLSWRVCAPTSVEMAHNILSLVLPHVSLQESTWAFILDEVRFQCEFAVRDYYFTTQRRSIIALAAIFDALDQLDQQDHQVISQALQLEIRWSAKDLLTASNRLLLLLDDNDAVAKEDKIMSDDAPSGESGACSLRVGPECCFDDQQTSSIVPTRTPPLCVSRCSSENALCENCMRS